jgi:hypothetical protein
MRIRAAGVVAILAMTSVMVNTAGLMSAGAQEVDDRASLGEWSDVIPWSFIPIHASIDQDGNVLTYGGKGAGATLDEFNLDVWDPSLGFGPESHQTSTHGLGTNLFCSFAMSNPDAPGTVILGGTISANKGLPNFVAQYSNGELTEFPAMHYPRWYGTGTVLWDGRLLMQGGTPLADDNEQAIETAEIYDAETGWTELTGTTDSRIWKGDDGSWWYPKSFVTPAGAVWNIADEHTYYLDPEGTGAVERLDLYPGTNIGGTSSAVSFAPGMVLQAGAGPNANIFDLNYDPPRFMRAAPMHESRIWGNAIVLPDGTVMMVGGSGQYNQNTDVAYAPEIWDPKTNTWTLLDESATPRLYHSTALLLPDGRIFSAGGGAPGPADHLNAEVFTPPYLFDADGQLADRLKIDGIPTELTYGETFSVSSDGPVDRVTFMKLGNSTHSMTTQNFMDLGFVQDGTELHINAPDLATVATPGEYMLFALDSDGVPSEALITRIGGTGATPPAALPNPEHSSDVLPFEYSVPRTFEAPVLQAAEPLDFVIDSGITPVGQTTAERWKTISFNESFTEPPVVIAGPATNNDSDAGVVQVRNITTTDFQIHFDEWSDLDGLHAREQVSWLAIDAGVHTVDGTTIRAGVMTDVDGTSWHRHLWDDVDERPAVLTQPIVDTTADAATVRLQRVGLTGFSARLQSAEAEGSPDPTDVGWIALDTGTVTLGDVTLTAGQRGATHRWRTVTPREGRRAPLLFAQIHTTKDDDTASLRMRYRGSRVQLAITEEASDDAELRHGSERLSWLIVSRNP